MNITKKISPETGDYISTPADFFSKFPLFMTGTTEEVFKLETRQTYQEPGNASYEAFMDGDLEKAKAAAWAIKQETESANWIDRCQRGISWTRVHLVEMPLSDYMKWEMLTYDISVKYGERILIVDITDEPQNSPLRNLSDFLLFDDKAVMAHNYDREGLIQGGWVIDTPEQIEKYQEAANLIMSKAVPLGVFEWPHGLK